ncbi:MAG: InlB B-repeat-containing protein, partial [Oscillospiraceae bacterium]|nr:InlB B-repeat-containing protein [Oscillospiraceae bacterium]
GTQVTSGTVLPWGNTVLTAGWDYEYYDLTFDTDGAGSADTVSYHIDDVLSLPSVSKKGYHLLGWFDQEENEYKTGMSFLSAVSLLRPAGRETPSRSRSIPTAEAA